MKIKVNNVNESNLREISVKTFLPAEWLSARRRTILVFYRDAKNNTLKKNRFPNIIFKGAEFFSIFEFNQLYIKNYDFHPKIIDDDDLPF